MDDLIKQITDKVGISPDQAKSAIETVMGFIGDKLPGPIASQVNKLLGDDDDDGGGNGDDDNGGGLLDQAKDALGGLLGGD